MSESVVSKILDAALAPELWPAALDALANKTGVAGGAYILQDKRTGQVEWASMTGPGTAFRLDYINHFAAMDPFLPIQQAAKTGQGVRLLDCIPAKLLSQSEWYNDFVLKSGLVDGFGIKLYENWAYSAFIALHQATGRAPLEFANLTPLREVLEPLQKTARLHVELRGVTHQSRLTARALDHLPIGAIIADRAGRAVEINQAAEGMIGFGDGLALRNGLLVTSVSTETETLLKFIAAAATDEPPPSAGGHMLLSGNDGRKAYAVTVTPLSTRLELYERPFALVMVVKLDEGAPDDRALSALFGLSPAEGRLTALLMTGQSLAGIATQQDVRIATLRSQLSSVLRKVGVARQSDLTHVLATVRMICRGQN